MALVLVRLSQAYVRGTRHKDKRQWAGKREGQGTYREKLFQHEDTEALEAVSQRICKGLILERDEEMFE